MVGYLDIITLVDQIALKFRPLRIILFGSYAWGKPSFDSDVDLLVVTPHQGESWRMATSIRVSTDPQFPLDLLVRTPAEAGRRTRNAGEFLKEIVETGIVLYESNDRAVDQKGRRRLRRRLHAAAVAQAQPI